MSTDLHELEGEPPPHSIEAEQGLLGAILANSRAFDRVSSILLAKHFFDAQHGEIYETMARVIMRGGIADPTTLMGVCPNEYLADLMVNAVTVINAPHYAEVIVNYATAREAIKAGRKLIEAGFAVGPDDKVMEAAAEALATIEDIGAGTEGGWVHISVAAEMAIAAAQAARDSGGRTAGLPTGLTKLDALTGGLTRGEVTIIAGRTGMGKTALAGSIALAAAKLGEPIAFFSLEMQAVFIGNRMLAILSGVSGDRARRGSLDDAAMQIYIAAKRQLDDLEIHIDEAASLTIEMISARARALHRRGKANLVIVDYLGLVEPSDKRERSRVYQIEHITKEAKRLAKSLNIPVLILVQISRAVEGREDKHPMLVDLRDSGAIEQDAGAVWLMYRDEYYVDRDEPKRTKGKTKEAHAADRADWEVAAGDSRGKAEIMVAKNRHGPANITVYVAFDGETSGFSNLVADDDAGTDDMGLE